MPLALVLGDGFAKVNGLHPMLVSLPATQPDAAGLLQKTPLANLLVYVRDRGLTGTLVFGADGGEITALSLRRGSPFKALVQGEELLLSSVCRDLGYASSAQLADTWELASQRSRLHGQVLLEYGVLDRDKLLGALALQLERKVAALAKLPASTPFRFFAGGDLLSGIGGVEEPEVSVERLLWVVLRQAAPWSHVGAALTKLDGKAMRVSASATPERFGLGAAESRLVASLRDTPRTLADLVAERFVDPTTLSALVYGLLVTKQVDLTRRMAHTGPVSEHPAASNPPSASGISSISSAVSLLTPISSITAPEPPSGVLNVQPPSSRRETAAESELRAEILARRETIVRENYFTILGIDANAPRDQVNAAYFQLAKRWHPDKLGPALADVRPAMAKIFSLLSEAHKTLTDPALREKYTRTLQEGGGDAAEQDEVQAVLDAAVEFQKAEVFLKRRDYAQAEEHARRALALDGEQGEHIALVAHLEAQREDSVTRLRDHIERLGKAIQRSPRSVKAHYYRAQLLKRTGKISEALADFREVLELEPSHVDAARELRLHAMRSTSSTGGGDSARGLFGKLFRNK